MILVFVSEVLNSRRIWQYWLFEWGSHPPCVWWHDFRTSYKEWIKLWKSISGSREQMEVKMYFYTSSSHQPSKISQLADQGNSAEWCHGTLEIRKRGFLLHKHGGVWRCFCSFKRKMGFQFILKKDANVLFFKKKPDDVWHATPWSKGWETDDTLFFSKEIILAVTQNMHEYCIRLNIWCRYTVTCYVNVYICRKVHQWDLVRYSLSFSKVKQSHLCESLITVRN